MPNAVTLSQVQQALTNVVLLVKVANGYSIDLPNDHVYKISQQQKLLSQDFLDYPKIVITLDSGTGRKGASRNFDRGVRFGVTIILREEFTDNPDDPPVGWKSVADQLRVLVQDLEQVILNNSDLGGLVDDVIPTEFETDSDAAYPEGILVYYFDINYRRQM